LETLGELSLSVDHVVVYASHGVGRVSIRREQSVVVEFANSGLTVSLPIERAIACVRPLSTEAEIASLGQTLGGADPNPHTNWQNRLKAAKAKVSGGDAVDLAEVIRDVSRREERAFARGEPGTISVAERQLYVKARRLLADEIGASRGVDPAEADEWIADRIAANADQEHLPQARGLIPFSGPFEAIPEPSGRRARRRRQ
jgi:RNA polymerase-interacting CarD/CdnL/TRCF family regulator